MIAWLLKVRTIFIKFGNWHCFMRWLLLFLMILPLAAAEDFYRPQTSEAAVGGIRNQAALQNMTVYEGYDAGKVYRVPDDYEDPLEDYEPSPPRQARKEEVQNRTYPITQTYQAGVEALRALGIPLSEVPPDERWKYVEQLQSQPFEGGTSAERTARARAISRTQPPRILSESYWQRARRRGDYEYKGLTGIAKD